VNTSRVCCCGSGTCDTCISTAQITADAGCCHAPGQRLCLWIDRPGRIEIDSACCPQVDETYDCFKVCCQTTIYESPPIRALYDYLGKGPKFRVVLFPNALGVDRPPIQCSACDTSTTAGDCCGTGFPPYANCVCDPDNYGKNVSPYQKSVMEDQPGYWLALDILCYDDGATMRWDISGDTFDAYLPNDTCNLAPYRPGSLWGHCLAIIHKEHWYRFADCGTDPNPYPPLTEPDGDTPFQCIGPKHFIYACSGAPLFTFDLDEAVDNGKITSQDRCDLLEQLAGDWTNPEQVPSQAILGKLCAAGYFDTRDWRETVRQEWLELKDRFPDTYTGTVPACSTMDLLGPIRRRLFRSQFVAGSGGTQTEWVRLQRSKARVPTTPNPDIQIPAAWDLDPWNGGPYPAQGDADYDDFIFWAERQYVYFHARPGGWDWSCWDAITTGGQSGEEDTYIPHIARRDSDICGGDCLDVSGFPRNYTVTDCGGEPGGQGCDDCSNIEVRTCGQGASCPTIGCSPQDYCLGAPENGGRSTPCSDVLIAANCDGIHFRYTRIRFVDTGIGSICDQASWRNAPKCEVLNHAYLFTLDRGKGDYDSACPWRCRDLQPPQAIADAVPNIYDSLLAYRGVCAAIQAGCEEAQLCCGTFCIDIVEDDSGCCDAHQPAPQCSPDPPGELNHPCA